MFGTRPKEYLCSFWIVGRGETEGGMREAGCDKRFCSRARQELSILKLGDGCFQRTKPLDHERANCQAQLSSPTVKPPGSPDVRT